MSDHRSDDDSPARAGEPARSALSAHVAGLDERRRQIAIALHYDRVDPSLPRVVASGTRRISSSLKSGFSPAQWLSTRS